MSYFKASRGPFYVVVDANSFFVSCERLFRPDLAGKPVVVLSSNDGCVVARSAEAKKLGIGMGEPYFKIEGLIKREKVSWFSSNFALYMNISLRLSDFINRQAGRFPVWQYSVDEWFIKVSDLDTSKNLAKEIINGASELGIPVAIGIAPTKTLAKAAIWRAKETGKGFYVATDLKTINNLLKIIPVGDVWGIGFKTQKKLKSTRLKTAHQLISLPKLELAKLSRQDVVFHKTIAELKGEACFDDERTKQHQQSMAMTRTFGSSTTKLIELEGIIAEFTTQLSRRMRQKKLLGGGAVLFIRRLDKHNLVEEIAYTRSYRLNRHYMAKRLLFERPTNETITILADLNRALKSLYRPGFSYDKAGVTMLNLIPQNFAPQPLHEQLFSSSHYQDHNKRVAIWQTSSERGQERLLKPATELLKGETWRPQKKWSSGLNPASLFGLPQVK